MIVLDSPTARVLPKRVDPVRAVVIHSTGEADLDKLLRFYTADDGLCPHYLIEATGTVRRIVAEDHVAWHCAISAQEAGLYTMGFATWSQFEWHDNGPEQKAAGMLPAYRWWCDEWRENAGLSSPLQLPTGRHPNAVSIGIELQSLTPEMRTPQGHTDAQYTALAELLCDVCPRYGLPISKPTIVGHADVNPLRRCDAGGPWDPDRRFSWNRLWDEITKVSR